MTVSRELLMRYHDGEISEAEARRVEAALDREPALQQELAAYSELGSFVRAWADVRSDVEIDIADDVMRSLDAAASRRARARVHPLLPRVATWVSLSVAIAAGSVLVARSWSAPPSAASASGVRPTATPDPGSSVANADLNPPASSEPGDKASPATIESVDFGKSTGKVFVVSTESSETPVVWMPDDGEPDDEDEDRTKSL